MWLLRWLALALLVAVSLTLGIDRLKRFVYPLRFEDLIMRSAREFRIDPFLVAAVIKVESGFRPDVTSKKGARGLMQILPDTGLDAARRIGITDYTADMLYDPATNIRLGTMYLSQLMTEFNGDLTLALAAYNGGLRRVREWRRDGLIGPAGDIERIPFEETRNYVTRVKSALKQYRSLYRDQLGAGLRESRRVFDSS